MLRASHRVLEAGGVICFAVITLADRLPEDEIRRGIEAGPPEVEAGPGYAGLLIDAGFRDLEIRDVTDEYLATSQAWVESWEADARTLRTLLGDEAFAERQENLRGAIEATRDGLLRRLLIRASKS